MIRADCKREILDSVAAIAVALLMAIASPGSTAQEYRNSIVATDFDFILENDDSTFVALQFAGEGTEEMPDKRTGSDELFQRAYVFKASFQDDTSVDLFIDVKLGSREVAESEAMRYVHPLGKLPTLLRRGVDRVVVHKGGADSTAFSDVGLIVIYADNATRRIATHDLEETVFHESVHAAWDANHAKSRGWRRAQMADGGFATVYARRNPETEDLAESALFAYTLLHHPDRIPPADRVKIRQAIPNRIAYIAALLPPDKPIHFAVKGEAKSGWDEQSDDVHCNIRLPGVFADVLSNCLTQRFRFDEQSVRKLTAGAHSRYANSEELFQAALKTFDLKGYDLKQGLAEFLHVNCKHATFDDRPAKRLIQSWSTGGTP